MDLINKFIQTNKIIILIFQKTQKLLIILALVYLILLFSVLFKISILFTYSLVSVSNLYLILLYNADNADSIKIFYKIYNIPDFIVFLTKILILYILFFIQIPILTFLNLKTHSSFPLEIYFIFTTNLFCLLIWLFNFRLLWKKILFAVLLLVLLILIYAFIPLKRIYISGIIVFITIFYSYLKLSYENNHYI